MANTCTEETFAVGFPGPNQAARHAAGGEGFAHAAAGIAQHRLFLGLRAADLQVRVFGASSRSGGEFAACGLVEHAADVGHFSVVSIVVSYGDLDVCERAHLRGSGKEVERGLLPPLISDPVEN